VVRDGDGLAATITASGPLANIGADPVQRATLTPVDGELFLATLPKSPNPIPFVFYDFRDGVPQSIHFGARAMPRSL
jgi:hypothetical protein